MTVPPVPTADGIRHCGPITATVVDGLPMPVMITRAKDDSVVRLNPEFSQLYGHTTEAVAGTPAARLHFEEEDRRAALGSHAEGGIDSVKVRVRSSTGSCHWARADISRFAWEGDEEVLLTTFYDVTSQELAEKELAERARFPAMNPGPVARLAADGTVIRANPAATSLFGEKSLEGLSWLELSPGIDQALWTEVREKDDFVRYDADIEDRCYSFTLRHEPIADQIFVYGSDVTELKLAERALSELARFPEMNPGPVCRLDREGTVLLANRAATDLFGRDSLEGASWLELTPGMDADVLEAVREGDETVHYEAEIGPLCYAFVLRHEPITDQIFVYGSDVTELRHAERALAELARFPEMNPGPVCRLSRDGTVLLANRAATDVFEAEDLSGTYWLDLVPTVDESFWRRVLDSSQPVSIEARIGKRDFVLTHAPGPEGIFVFVYGSDVTREKEAERALRQSEKMATLGTLAAGVAHELNNPAAAAQRAAEQLQISFAASQGAQAALRALALTEETEALLGELDAKARETADCPCELDPLTRSDLEAQVEDWLDRHGSEAPWEVASILVEGGYDLGSLEALGERVGSEGVDLVTTWHAHSMRVYRLLEEIRHGTGRLVEIVGAMKAYSYLGQAALQNVDVNEGIRNTLVILRSKLKAGIVVEQDLAPGLPRIEALGSELNQVWTNLIDNAADAMNGRGRMRLRSSLVGDRIRVEVEDDGEGIPEDVQSHIFDAFFTTKPPGKGTGLGLNTTYNVVVTKHGGSIHVESRPGRTSFIVELPVDRPPRLGSDEQQTNENPTEIEA